MVLRKIIEERIRKGPILKRLREQFFKTASRFLDPEEFQTSFKDDIRESKYYVLLISPFLNRSAVDKFLDSKKVKEALNRGIKIIVVTRPSHLKEVNNVDEHKECIEKLTQNGIKVIERPKLHFKSVIVDESIAYIGSINPLNIVVLNYIPDDYMIRFESEALVDEIIERVIGKDEFEKWTS